MYCVAETYTAVAVFNPTSSYQSSLSELSSANKTNTPWCSHAPSPDPLAAQLTELITEWHLQLAVTVGICCAPVSLEYELPDGCFLHITS